MAIVIGEPKEVLNENEKVELSALNKLKSVFKSDNSVVIYFKPVIYNPRISREISPDILIFFRDLGCVVVEVKAWSLEYAKDLKIDKNGMLTDGKRRFQNPLKEVRRFVETLLDIGGGPASFVFFLPNMNRLEHKKLPKNIREIIPEDRTIFRFESDDSVKSKILQHLSPFSRRLTPSEVRLNMEKLRAKLFPFVNIPSSQKSLKQFMDYVQEGVLYERKPGHYVLRGGPGTGKTVVLVGKAIKERILDLKEGKRRNIGIISYTNSIVSMIKRNIDRICSDRFLEFDSGDFLISTLHRISFEILDKNQKRLPKESDSVDEVVKLLKKGEIFIPEKLKFDVLLVDESQDFKKDWFLLIKSMLKKNALVVFAVDETQRIYDDRDWKWKDTPFPVRGKRVIILRKAYRTGEGILRFGISFLKKDPVLVRKLKELEAWESLESAEFVKSGTQPKVLVGEQYQLLVRILRDLLKQYRPKDIFVLTPYSKSGKLSLEKLREVIVKSGVLSNDEINTQKEFDEEKLNIFSYHRAKGLENKCVILLGADKLPYDVSTKAKDKRRDRRLFYVAMTRAQEKLFIMGEKEAGFLKEVKELLEGGKDG